VLITTVLFGEIDGDWMKKKKKIEIICHHLHQYFYILLGGYFHCGINRQFGKGKGLCKIEFAQNKCILSCTQISFASTNKVLQKIRRHLAFGINWN
jgi:hypothetical protein